MKKSTFEFHDLRRLRGAGRLLPRRERTDNGVQDRTVPVAVLQQRVEHRDQFRPPFRAAGNVAEPGLHHVAALVEQLDRGPGHRHLAEIEPLSRPADPAPHQGKPGFALPKQPVVRFCRQPVPGGFELVERGLREHAEPMLAGFRQILSIRRGNCRFDHDPLRYKQARNKPSAYDTGVTLR